MSVRPGGLGAQKRMPSTQMGVSVVFLGGPGTSGEFVWVVRQRPVNLLGVVREHPVIFWRWPVTNHYVNFGVNFCVHFYVKCIVNFRCFFLGGP